MGLPAAGLHVSQRHHLGMRPAGPLGVAGWLTFGVMGTEGAGLSAHWLAQADVVVRIPMGHGVDSLNVAAATAVACYVLRR